MKLDYNSINKDLKLNCFTVIVELSKGLITDKRASEFYERIADSEYSYNIFSRISCGDIICWKKNIIPKSGDSGHLCIVDEVLSDGEIRVFDYAKLPHTNDTGNRPGPGIGLMKLIVEEDKMIGFIWSNEIKKTKFTKVLGINPKDLNNIY